VYACEKSIFRHLIAQADTGALLWRRVSTEAHLRRLPEGGRGRLLDLAQILLWMPWLDINVHVIAVLTTMAAAAAVGGQLIGPLILLHRARLVLAFKWHVAYLRALEEALGPQ
jgi:hypothetical protein